MKQFSFSNLSRRDFLQASSLAMAGSLLGGRANAWGERVPDHVDHVPLALPALPYDYTALEPYIDARTMKIHHGRHHAAYTNNVVEALRRYPAYAAQPLENVLADIPSLPADIQTAVRNNGGGHWNHELFWEIMSPDGGGEPSGAVRDAIDNVWGDFATMQSEFNRAGATQFGSGWAWLLVNEQGNLQISSTPNQDNPLMHGLVEVTGQPILGLDVWEHAYYLHYQNRRGDYMDAWWNVVNWPRVEALYHAALGRRV